MTLESHWDERALESEKPTKAGPEVSIIKDFIVTLKPKKVLEIGMNYGRELKELEGLALLHGVDFNQKMVDAAKVYVKGKFEKADARRLPYRSPQFDFVYTDGVLSHIDPECVYEAISEAIRVSKNYILIVEYLGTRQGRNTISNCKKFTWVHDYDKLLSTQNVIIQYKQTVFFGSDMYYIALLQKLKFFRIEKSEEGAVETVVVPEEKKHRFEIKIGKHKWGIG